MSDRPDNTKTRTCPDCGTKWSSADAESPWDCDACGAKIPVPEPIRIQASFGRGKAAICGLAETPKQTGVE